MIPLIFNPSPFLSVNNPDQLLIIQSVYYYCKKKLGKYPFIRSSFNNTTYEITIYDSEKMLPGIINVTRLFNCLTSYVTISNPPEKTTMNTTFSKFFLSEKSYEKFLEQKELLLEKSTKFQKDIKVQNIDLSIFQTLNPSSLIHRMLFKWGGIALGKAHTENIADRLLIDYMGIWATYGVKVIFLEFFYFDTSMQQYLDNYILDDSCHHLPPHLSFYLADYGSEFRSNQKESTYTLLRIVQEAKKHKIRLVGLDTTLSFSIGTHRKKGVINSYERSLAFSYTAFKIIKKERKNNEKFLTFSGNAHVSNEKFFTNANNTVLGLSQLLNVPSLVVQNGKESQVQLNTNIPETDIVVNMLWTRKTN